MRGLSREGEGTEDNLVMGVLASGEGWLQSRGVGVGDEPGLEYWSWLDGVELSCDYWV